MVVSIEFRKGQVLKGERTGIKCIMPFLRRRKMQSIIYFNAKLKEKTVKFVKEAMCKVKTSDPCRFFYITGNEMFIEREIYEIHTFELRGKE